LLRGYHEYCVWLLRFVELDSSCFDLSLFLKAPLKFLHNAGTSEKNPVRVLRNDDECGGVSGQTCALGDSGGLRATCAPRACLEQLSAGGGSIGACDSGLWPCVLAWLGRCVLRLGTPHARLCRGKKSSFGLSFENCQFRSSGRPRRQGGGGG
jgi:hypothetical protein